MPSRSVPVDIAKIIASFFVIGIHTRPLSGFSEIADFFLCDVVFRTAIPFFAVCTGYYLTKKIDNSDNSDQKRIVISMALRILFMYVTWSLFYLIVLCISWYETGLLTMSSLLGWSKSFLFGSPFYHLWYLAQLFWALLFFYPIIKYLNRGWQVTLLISLWLFGVFAYVYSDVIGVGNSIVTSYARLGAISESLGRILPLLLVGSVLARRTSTERHSSPYYSALFLVFLVVEVVLLRFFGASRYSYVISTLPLSYFLFDTIRLIKTRCLLNTKGFSKASMIIYLIHPAIILVLKQLSVESPLCLFILTVLISTGFGLIWQYWCKDKRLWVR